MGPLSSGLLEADAALPSLLQRLEWHTDAAKYNRKKRFDFVLGVFLSAIPRACDGCLWVRRGSHCARGRLSQPDELAREGRLLEHPSAPGASGTIPILIDTPGTAIVFHKDLLHAGGPNLGPAIRYALYFRLRLEER
eukprot:6192686-Pleurochrysis_carterae.AAC.4